MGRRQRPVSAPAAAKCPLRPLSLPSFPFSPCPHLHLSWLPGEILGSRVKTETEWGLGPPLPAAQGAPHSRLLLLAGLGAGVLGGVGSGRRLRGHKARGRWAGGEPSCSTLKAPFYRSGD